jgi:CBS-domain-containing membrane protein
MKVKDVMTKKVNTCTTETDLAAAAESMWRRDCGFLPIVDTIGEVVGVITDRDICIAAGCHRRDPATVLVREVMAQRLYSCSPEADLCDALQIMQQQKVRRLPVIDSAGELCGVLSLNDIVLKVGPNEKGSGAREIHAVLRSICARRGQPQEVIQEPQSRIQRQEALTAKAT